MAKYGLLQPGSRWVAITKSDSVNLSGPPRAVYIGVSGDVVMVGDDDVAVTFKALPVGIHQISPKRINSTSTTATDMVAIY